MLCLSKNVILPIEFPLFSEKYVDAPKFKFSLVYYLYIKTHVL